MAMIPTGRSLAASWLVMLSLLVPFLAFTAADEIGSEICACAPGEYEFTLDFSLFCPPVNITVGDAVAATSCMVSPFADPEVADLVPVAVQSIDILELNQDLQITVQETIEGNFGDGDTFQYTSIAALPGEIVDPNDIPRAIQLNILGINKFDEPIVNVFIITFSNNCGRYPVLFEGQYAGWVRFHDLQPPLPELCPLAEVPSASPSMAPSDMPSASPSTPPSSVPTTPSPTGGTPPPTPSPTPSPTMMSMSMDLSMSMLAFDSTSLVDLMENYETAWEFGRGFRFGQKATTPRKRLYKQTSSEPNTVSSVTSDTPLTTFGVGYTPPDDDVGIIEDDDDSTSVKSSKSTKSSKSRKSSKSSSSKGSTKSTKSTSGLRRI